MRYFAILAIWLGLIVPVLADSEKVYVQAWAAAHQGKANVRLPDGTRCAVVTPTHAVEFAFGRKWQEAVGRSLYEASQLNKHPGIVLIMEDTGDAIYRQRLDTTITVFNLPIDVWEVGAGAEKGAGVEK